MRKPDPASLANTIALLQQVPPSDHVWKVDEVNEEAAIVPFNFSLIARHSAKVLCLSNPRSPDQHHRYVWMVCLKGEGKVGVSSRIVTLRPGEFILVQPFQSHFFMDFRQDDIFWYFVIFDHAKNIRLQRISEYGPLPLTGSAHHLFQDFAKACAPPAKEPIAQLYFGLILEHLAALEGVARPSARDASAEQLVFIKVSHFVVNHRHRLFSIDELAQHVGLSPSYLRNLFRRVTGRSLGLFIREIRLSHACELLDDPKLRISEIAERCGYDSPFVFSRAFRKHFNCSPSTYRRKNMEGIPPAAPADIALQK